MIHSALVSDSGPFISLERIPAGFLLLRRLVARVLIPPHVLEELTAGLRIGTGYLDHHGIADLVHVVMPPSPPPETQALDIGERYAIALALHEHLPLMIEERAGWRVADALGLTTTGTIGLLLDGHAAGMVPTEELTDTLAALRKAGRIGQALFDTIVRDRLKH